ncbi:MAG: alpha/beta hydrolase, partial [Nonomuraea sp.]|nr:alpha/beta hydrolase [Nonomuraea sp.]
MTDVRVIVGPGVVADEVLLREVAEREFARLGVVGSLVHVADAARLRELLSAGTARVAIPGPEPEPRELIGEPADGVVWLDLHRCDGVQPGPGAGHLHGRGLDGLIWAIRHAVHRSLHEPRRIPYGTHPDQWGELYLPDAPGPHPVVALVHGGYWRAIWGADLMDALSVDLAGRGFAVWNLEYRRPDLHGWDATTGDLAAGLAALA